MIEVPAMSLSSSPVVYPASSPAALSVHPPKPKRKLFQKFDFQQPLLKKPRLSEPNYKPSENTRTSWTDNAVEKCLDSTVTPTTNSRPVSDEQLNSLPPQPQEIAAKLLLLSDTTSSHLDAPSSASLPLNLGRGLTRKTINLQTTSGGSIRVIPRKKQATQTYEQVIAGRSVTNEGRAKRAYYGVDIHELVNEAKIQRELDQAEKELRAQREADIDIQPSIELARPQSSHSETGRRVSKHQMWTEKYRAKKFTELVGDERTHRSVLRWLKAWDNIVFPGAAKKKTKKVYEDNNDGQEQQHRKIMLLTGPPGLGKTTLAHVCAKQAGYEVLEINASDDRSRDVVKGRIKDALGTETVRGIQEEGKTRKAGRPVCVVVDEVDGVVTGSGGSGGEGGFMKALIDLVQLDQKNASMNTTAPTATQSKRKGDKFKMLRPLILICNDVYAPSLRPLRNSSMAEIVHVRRPPIDKVIARLKSVFEKENIRCDNDAVRRLCEDCWGMGSRKQNSNTAKGAGEGDIRGVLVQGEWFASKLRISDSGADSRLTRKWVEAQLSETPLKGHKGLGRGGIREVIDRIFLEGAGLPHQQTALSADEARQIKESENHALGVADLRKRSAIHALREMANTCGDHDRLMTDCFQTYTSQVFQDDTFLSKPNASYDWLHFHDSLSGRIFSGQEWELGGYLSTSACAFHNLFASMEGTSSSSNDVEKQENMELAHPFSGSRADFASHEALKQNRTALVEMQSGFSADLLRLFSSIDNVAAELVPHVYRMISPDVKPVVVGGSAGGPSVASVRKESERNCVGRSVGVMSALNVSFEKVRIENEREGSSMGTMNGGWAFRMEPPIDSLSAYHFSGSSSSSKATTATSQPTRYAIRQVLDQELRKEKVLQASAARQARGSGALSEKFVQTPREERENVRPLSKGQDPNQKKTTVVRRDFFGRPIENLNIIAAPAPSNGKGIDASSIAKSTATKGKALSVTTSGENEDDRIWVSFNEGSSTAVRKPITLSDLLEGF
ncbi:Chromosome transmission fidelity protein 18 [Lithohypha guttulata]|uniref:Chromosome transmission fidelity protein 18 n=1 Tax=Lithohypha guttulata TaxID=1690604 RepID=A0AAN7YI26_9EURO|nr:Chromosome transmission fidelity protein 18 [Lithohypha guttulata]